MSHYNKEFYDYCSDFYLGKNSIYSMIGLTPKLLEEACNFFAKSPNFRGDSYDTELVRQALEAWGVKWAENPLTENGKED